MDKNCRFARYVNILVGIFLMGLGIVFMLAGVTVFPLVGFYLAFPTVIGAVYFLAAPPDRTCFVS
jgi:hypothetical protein